MVDLFGGRPMRFVRHAFVDVVSGATVNYYIDRNGKHWLACGPWSLFRIETAHSSREFFQQENRR
jgi:hypothetical protein